ncbi:hypothetical protein SteCoe_13698 [Stentor coeruleus]|uniref:Uncharacterized protein n=1 Tax=Stentor coeruleus TaxID=5963 RepID=A0A1R2C7Y1_9CILI|nr:hypothetical protein SteCoe_13698 [Stentor coeruleus]
MEKFDNPYAKLFYAVYKLHSLGTLNNEEKVKLKGMIALSDSSIVKILNTYLEDQNDDSLMHEIVILVRPARQKPEAIITTKSTNDDISSPLGTFLHEKKKRQLAEHELKLSLKNTEIPSIIETHDEEIHLFSS